MVRVELNVVKDLLAEAVDTPRLQQGRRRQESVATGTQPDYAPLLLGDRRRFVSGFGEDLTLVNGEHWLDGGTPVREIADYPHFPLAEQIQSPEKMLYEALWGVLSWARTPSDAQLSIRPPLLSAPLTCFGVEYEVNEQGCPWFPNPIDLHRAIHADMSNLADQGQVPMVLDALQFFKEHTVPGVRVSCPIGAGPFNVIDAMLGRDLWLLLYDEPQKVHALMAKITDVIAELLRLYKEVVGEPMTTADIGPLYLARGGVKIGSDSMVMASPEMYREFVQPYTERLCREFGGGYHHSCGYYPKHFKILCQAEHVTLVNFGQPELWNMTQAVAEMHDHDKFYYGGWARHPGEPIEDYLRRGVGLCGASRNRAVLHAFGENEDWPDPSETMDLWHRLQDEIYPA